MDKKQEIGVKNIYYCRRDSTFISKNDGTLWATGRNDRGQFGDGTNKDRKTPVKIA